MNNVEITVLLVCDILKGGSGLNRFFVEYYQQKYFCSSIVDISKSPCDSFDIHPTVHTTVLLKD
jgi:hypothetical protein